MISGPLAESCLSLDIGWLHRNGVLRPPTGKAIAWQRSWRLASGYESALAIVCSSSMRIELVYYQEGDFVGEIGFDGLELVDAVENTPRNDERWIRYSVPIVYTTPNYGGWRPWFQCPASRCSGRRVGKLFLANRYFFCRHCYRIRYACQPRRSAAPKAPSRPGTDPGARSASTLDATPGHLERGLETLVKRHRGVGNCLTRG